MSRTAPQLERVLECARRLAQDLHHVTVPEADLRDRIEHVLWGRKRGWAAVEDGTLSEAELRDLLIDHLDYECAHLSGKAWAQFDPAERQAFADALDQVLFDR